jgi:glucose-6-phosphate 1-dehydrogenase
MTNTPNPSAVDPFDFVIFGATGDLSLRKIIPALWHRHADGKLPDETRIVLVARSAETAAAIAGNALPFIEKASGPVDQADWEAFGRRLSYQAIDVMTANGFDGLRETLETVERNRVFYLSLSPSLFGATCQQLDANGLINERTRVVLEKPLGRDLAGAQEINDAVAKVLTEHQTYRIDHYLGKETVQNLLALRFANRLFETQWNAAGIDHVQITVAETVGVGSRGNYYDQYGALRDMVQNHILQLLCLVAMEPPVANTADSVRDEKVKVLSALKPIGPAEFSDNVVFGQYRDGLVAGEAVGGYVSELDADASTTETFVALKAEVHNWRWAGVPFYLRTGKRLPTRASEIVVTFKPVPHLIFDAEAGHVQPNRLIMRLQPDEGLKLFLMSKTPGPGGVRLQSTALNLSFAEAFDGARMPDAYERLLMDTARGNQTLFMRRDEVEAAWRWIDPILEEKARRNLKPELYAAGTWGPRDADHLIRDDDRSWVDPDEHE